ncbi:glutathione S-transferase [Rhodoferax sp. GW822-FHT02A01]|uniref:glutathione S-transferase family protein n=1 Tax=Rhodoferax sp. GW822-FHT02A01 TaxID=3141537 RepID=UPI00315D75BD
MLHIWGRLSSLNVRKVVWAAQEVGVPFQRTDAGLSYGVVRTPEYRSMNPNSEVPTIQDGDLVLWESNVIVRYLCAKHANGTLYPQDLTARFDAERWMDWQQTTFNRAAGTAFVQWFRTPAEKRDMAAIAQSVAATQPLLALLDAHLAQHAYMGGDHFTMADIPLGCDVQRWLGLPEQHPALPNLRRWIAALLARPGAKGVLDLPLS